MSGEATQEERMFWLCALALAAPPFVIPAFNHDIYWHLLAARWIWAHHRLPSYDFLSWTMPRAPWLDFEWLWELVAAAFYRLGGLAGLWDLKVLLFLANFWAMERLLRGKNIQTPWLQAALVLWSAQMLPRCSVQPELLSTLFFTLTIILLESFPLKFSPRALFAVFFLFALWAQFHAAFVMGLALFAAYALADAGQGRYQAAAAKFAAFIAAALGSLCNPYGIGPYKILLWHAQASDAMTRFIREWSPMPFNAPFYWPFWATLAILAALAAFSAIRALRKPGARASASNAPWGLALAAAVLAVLAIRHSRFSSYFNAPACVLAAFLAQNAFGTAKRQARGLAALFFAAYAAFLVYFLPRLSWSLSLNRTDLPQGAAAFMSAERQDIEPLKLYHPWEWGGYLGWRLRPWFKIFGDGRYIFHEQHAQAEEAFGSARAWQGYLKGLGADGALLPNVDILINSQRRYPDGTLKAFRRPWFVFYMPRARWALVYWDSRALLFVARKDAPRAWLQAHEYRYLHPKDEAAFEDALKRGEINRAELKGEHLRHQAEMRKFGAF